jgi:hypothetical protein
MQKTAEASECTTVLLLATLQWHTILVVDQAVYEALLSANMRLFSFGESTVVHLVKEEA